MDEIKVKLNYDPSKSTSYSDLIKANAELVKALIEAAVFIECFVDPDIEYIGIEEGEKYRAIADKFEMNGSESTDEVK